MNPGWVYDPMIVCRFYSVTQFKKCEGSRFMMFRDGFMGVGNIVIVGIGECCDCWYD